MVRRLRLVSPTRALWLYALLLLVPAGVFAFLAWKQAREEHQRLLADAPQRAVELARRLQTQASDILQSILVDENERPFEEYQVQVWDQELRSPLPSPLYSEPLPDGVLCYFQYDEGLSGSAEPRPILGSGSSEMALELAENGPLNDLLVTIDENEAYLPPHSSQERVHLLESLAATPVPAGSIAYYLWDGREPGAPVVADFARRTRAQINVFVEELKTRLIQRAEGQFYLVGIRMVHIHKFAPGEGEVLPQGLTAMRHHNGFLQGFVIDGQWLLERLPEQLAGDLLFDSEHDLRAAWEEDFGPDFAVAGFDLLEGIDPERLGKASPELGKYEVGVNVADVQASVRRNQRWFLGVTAVMLVSAVMGLSMLLGRLKEASEHARRTENFIASVTHELRTPLAAVKMYAEMLRDGWARDEAKKQEYAERIANETNRLDALVDRVLEKRRLSGAPPELVPGDLSAEVGQQRQVLGLEEAQDVRFDLAPDLPAVLLTREAIHAMVQNLVENARKYAPVDLNANEVEPILVRTRQDRRGRVLLEVLDRGPGIPPKERDRVFEAFYRIGDEATRTTQGTGLGLHLVAQYAKQLKGRVAALPRQAGGTRIQIALKRA